MKFGLYTMCYYDNDAPEPEGTVLYDKLPPDVGTKIKLCDGEVWVVTEFTEHDSTVHVKRNP
jgi:hypothetical protein